jgi:hypothetical protein
VPNRCLVEEELQCYSVRFSEVTEESDYSEEVALGNLTPKHQVIAGQSSASTSALHLKRKYSKSSKVASKVTRSERLKSKSQGFKQEANLSRSCFCCGTEPPTISDKVIRSLGKDFCKMSSEVISDVSLKKKPLPRKSSVPSRGQSNKEEK